MLDLLKLYPHSDVPHNLLMNPCITPGVIEEIAASTDFEHVRAWTASHPKAPASLVQRLLNDPDHEVRTAALTHWACPVQFLTAAVRTKDFDSWKAVAGNARTPRNILLRLALYEYDAGEYANEDEDEWAIDRVCFRDVLVALASNPMTPRHVVERLAVSDDGTVAEAAQANPAKGTEDILAPS
ncbi:hypothetical protein CXZ05_06960 [Arthrobacter sp. AFG20]|nr:hypothetical protein CXZ05_06960 [Arthrobacter sp. AFG20]